VRTMLAPVAAAFVLATAPAYADVTYDFILESIGPDSIGYTLGTRPGTTIAWFTVTAAVVESGSMSFTASASCSSCFSVDFPGYFLSAGFNVGGAVFDDGNDQNGMFDVTFNADGTLSGLTDFGSSSAGYQFGGTEYAWSGSAGAELYSSSFPITGYWLADDPLPVAEPSGAALFFPALAATLWLYRRRGAPVSRA
jgi:hypothetical protein